MRNSEDTDVYARWLDFPGEQLISQVEVEIGGQRIDRQYGDWMHIWNQLTLSAEQQRGYYKMIGNTTQLTSLILISLMLTDLAVVMPPSMYVLLATLFPKPLFTSPSILVLPQPGLALPLIALQYHEVKINLDLRPIDECLWAVVNLTETEMYK